MWISHPNSSDCCGELSCHMQNKWMKSEQVEKCGHPTDLCEQTDLVK